MSATSASFRYDSLGLAGRNIALVPDVASLCSPSSVSGISYLCTGALNFNTSRTSWDYLKDVYTGGQRTVDLYGEQGDKKLGANVTLGDVLDIFNMPDWDSIVHIYQKSTGTGPISDLNPFIAVMLAQRPVLQKIVGAAAWCEFNGSTGGQWPDILWPSLNHTSNVVLGTVIEDQPTMGTALLNFGPGWQYNLLSGDYLPGGSVSYIANITGPGVNFSALFTSYVRNQWALMAYSIAPQSGQQIALSFIGSGPDQLYISLTLVALLPFAALGIGLLVTLGASIRNIRERYWIKRVEFESWWLFKVLRHEDYKVEYCNATEGSFVKLCEDFTATYRKDGGYLEISEIERT
ncbi:hypothetical protein V8E51_015956 [Hyaloscypha variabilis]